jgi:hypothetical protein
VLPVTEFQISNQNMEFEVLLKTVFRLWILKFLGILDPEPDPLVGSESFYHLAKIVRKTLILLFCDLIKISYL